MMYWCILKLISIVCRFRSNRSSCKLIRDTKASARRSSIESCSLVFVELLFYY